MVLYAEADGEAAVHIAIVVGPGGVDGPSAAESYIEVELRVCLILGFCEEVVFRLLVAEAAAIFLTVVAVVAGLRHTQGVGESPGKDVAAKTEVHGSDADVGDGGIVVHGALGSVVADGLAGLHEGVTHGKIAARPSLFEAVVYEI